MIIGFIYDLYRISRRIFRPRKLATFIEDLLFWLVIGAAAFFVLILSNDGQLRLYTFLGFVTGSMLYISFLSPYVLKLILLILRIIKKVCMGILRILIFPIRKIIFILKIPARWIKKKIQPIYTKAKRVKQLPKRWVSDMKKHARLILRKK